MHRGAAVPQEAGHPLGNGAHHSLLAQDAATTIPGLCVGAALWSPGAFTSSPLTDTCHSRRPSVLRPHLLSIQVLHTRHLPLAPMCSEASSASICPTLTAAHGSGACPLSRSASLPHLSSGSFHAVMQVFTFLFLSTRLCSRGRGDSVWGQCLTDLALTSSLEIHNHRSHRETQRCQSPTQRVFTLP